jgi:hypothetical protein
VSYKNLLLAHPRYARVAYIVVSTSPEGTREGPANEKGSRHQRDPPKEEDVC